MLEGLVDEFESLFRYPPRAHLARMPRDPRVVGPSDEDRGLGYQSRFATGGFVLRRLWNSRFLVGSLVRRQFQIRYRQSFAGYWWAILPPLGMLAAGILVF